MTSTLRRILVTAALSIGTLVAGIGVGASGGIGVYGIVERVVFEPNEAAPLRLQVWGAFSFVEAKTGGSEVSPARRGYLYFRTPDDARRVPVVLGEWKSLKTVAGTGQVVGFGAWGYLGGFATLDPQTKSPRILELYPTGGVSTDLRVRPATEAPASPTVYQTDSGMVRIAPTGSRADVVRDLQAALKAP